MADALTVTPETSAARPAPGTVAQAARSDRLLNDRLAYALLALGSLLHLGLVGSFHLSPDEAHYALYALHLDWSYFDHPPLVGWLQWPAVALGGSDLLLRLVPALCWLGAGGGLYRLTALWWPGAARPQRMASGGAGTLPTAPGRQSWGYWPAAPSPAQQVLVLWVLAPLPHLLGLALVPDSLLMPLTCAAMATTWALCDATRVGRFGLWLALGLCLGLAGLAKYTAVLLAGASLLALAWAHGLRLLRLPGTWLTAVLALALVAPVFVWNAQNGWISFTYQLGHAGGGPHWQAWHLQAFVLVQLLVFGALPLWGWWLLLRQRPGAAAAAAPCAKAAGLARQLSPTALCACFGLPLLLLLCYLSGKGATLPHWSAPAWVALLPAAAAGLHSARPGRGLRWAHAGQLAICVLMVALLVAGGWAQEEGPQQTSGPGEHVAQAPRNPVADLYGWGAAARRAQALAQELGVPALAVMHWSLASRIAWYARPLPVQVVRRHNDQFDLWFGGLQAGDRVVLVDWSLMSFAPPVGPQAFVACRPLAQQAVRHAGRQLAHFNFLLCEGWQGPALPPPGSAATSSLSAQ